MHNSFWERIKNAVTMNRPVLTKMRKRKDYIDGLQKSKLEKKESKFLQVSMYSSTHDEKGYPLEQEFDGGQSCVELPE